MLKKLFWKLNIINVIQNKVRFSAWRILNLITLKN